MRRAVMIVAGALMSLGSLTGARCAPQGGWNPQLPVMTRYEWLGQEPLDRAIRFGQRPGPADEWIQLGWTRGSRLPVWQHIPK